MDPLRVEPPEVVKEAEGQNESLKKTENLLEIVKKLQKEGSLEPQIKDLIHCINDIQQENSSEEQQEAQALREALRMELDSLNEEKVHLEEVLRKKKAALRTLQLHCQRRSKAQRLPGEEELECLRSQHKELWEFHILRRRLSREIPELQGSLEQLLREEGLARSKLLDLEPRLHSLPEVEGPLPEVESVQSVNALKVELEIFGAQVQAPAQSPSENRAGQKQIRPKLPGDCTEEEEEVEEEEEEVQEEEMDGVETLAQLSQALR